MPGYTILVLFVHLIVTVVAESRADRHQILILNRSWKQAPNLRVSDRIIAGLCTVFMHPSRLLAWS